MLNIVLNTDLGVKSRALQFDVEYSAEFRPRMWNIELYIRHRSNSVVSNVELGERGGSVVECRTPEREVRGSRPTAAVLCP